MLNLKDRISNSAFVFRGYNVTNLGRSPELLAHAAYGPIVESYLHEASAVCCDVLSRKVDLVRRIEEKSEPTLDQYAEAVAIIVAMSQAQLKLFGAVF